MLKRIRHKLFKPSPYQWQTLEARFKNKEEKEVQLFVVWSEFEFSISELERKLKPIVLGQKFTHCKLWLRDSSVKSFTLRDNTSKQLGKVLALISAEGMSKGETEQFCKAAEQVAFTIAAYKAKQSIPLAYDMSWGRGERSPGLVSLSFFKKKPEMSTQEFREYWFGAHTPFALDIHPLWNYERNAIEQCLTEGMPEFDAIVPLHLAVDSDLRFSRFFASNGKNPLFNALRIQSDVEQFINLKQIETVAMREYVLS